MTLAIGIDIGGSKILGGVISEDGSILATARVASPAQDSSAIADAITTLLRQLRADPAVDADRVTAIGVGAAGYVSRDQSRIIYGANVAWRNEPLGALVAERTGLPVVVENDANAAAWGEYVHGAGAGARGMLIATIGTGIGGGIVLDGALYRGGFGGAGEIGHIRLVQDGRECGCGLRGCWETYASGRALTRDAREMAAASPEKASYLLELAGGNPQRITGTMVSKAAEQDDEVAIAAFDELERRFGEGLASVAVVLDPDVIVVGGGVSEAHELNLDGVRHSLTRHISGGGKRPEPDLRRAVLGNTAGIIGAASLARG